jgi:folate-binding protein YgfZ
MVSPDGYQAARTRAAAIARTDRGRIVLSGQDRASYLQGLLTNDIAALAPGQGCYAAYLTPQGRMIADLYVHELGDVMLVTVPRAQTRVVIDKFEQFIFSEDVRLGDASDSFATVAIVGPNAAAVLREVSIDGVDFDGMSEHAARRGSWTGEPVIVTRVTDTGEAGYDVYVDAAKAPSFQQAIELAKVPFLDPDTADVLRLEAGIPKFGSDMTEDTIPLEAGIETRAISFSKGCYVGQEVIIRVLHRGHGRVARKLAGLTIESADVPAAGAIVASDAREIGQVTSAVLSPALQRPIALAYVHRDFLAVGTAVAVNGAPAVVAGLPFVNSSARMPDA